MIFLLICSIFFQLLAVFFSIRLILITKKYFAWLFIVGGVTLMAVRRIITLYLLVNSDLPINSASGAEYVALIESIVLAVGILLIEPLFRSIKNNQLEVSLKIIELKKSNKMAELINKELVEAKGKAEESEKLKSAFLANLSHEIRTPMNGILGFTDLLKNSELSLDERGEYIRIIHKSGNHLLSVITDIIEISKIDSGLITPNYATIDINSFIRELIHALNFSILEKEHVKFILDHIPDENIYINTDELKLTQIITNLITNAMKYTQKGVVHVGMKIINKNQLTFYVKDTGIGIPDNLQKSIFTRFYQIEGDASIEAGGSGLGLAITKEYVHMLNGRIWVESMVDIGSKFSFEIPVSIQKNIDKQDLPNNVYEELNVINDFNRAKILVVEDNEVNYLLISKYIDHLNLEILWAENGKIAVELAKKHDDIAIVLMDIKMPIMNGYKALEEIRLFNKHTPIIAQSAHVLDYDITRMKEVGFNDIISKPIKKEDLINLITGHINLVC